MRVNNETKVKNKKVENLMQVNIEGKTFAVVSYEEYIKGEMTLTAVHLTEEIIDNKTTLYMLYPNNMGKLTWIKIGKINVNGR